MPAARESEIIAITRWSSLTDNRGRRAEHTWAGLRAWLGAPAPKPLDPEQPKLAGWSAALFADNARAKAAVESVTALALDVDSGDVQLEQLRKALRGRCALAHPTRRSTPAAPRWRVVIAVSRPMTAEEHAIIWAVERDRLASLAVAIDEQTKDPSRFWFVPCHPAAGEFLLEEVEGEPLDVDAVLAAQRRLHDVPMLPNVKPGAYGAGALADACRKVASASNGSRNATLNAQAFGIAQLVAGGEIDAHEARSRLVSAGQAAGLGEAETLRTVASAFDAGEHEPRTKPARESQRATTREVSKPLLTPGDRVRALADLGPIVRLPTMLPTLDRDCRGGLPTRRLVVVGGAPGAGKTTLATNWAWAWAKAGIPVAFLAVDEGPEGVLARIAQLERLHRDGFEERDPDVLKALAATVDATPLMIFDGDDANGTVEGVVAELAKRGGDGPLVLVCDSLQTIRSAESAEADGPRERVDAVVRALKAARDAHGLLIVATCELARGSYRSKATAEQINDLAAFKESGGIEYAAQTALVLRSVPDESDLVDVAVPKNRAYCREPFRLRLDHVTTTFLEVPTPDAPSGAEKEKAKVALAVKRVAIDAQVIANLVARNPGIGERALRAVLKQNGHSWGVDRINAAKLHLGARLENRGPNAKHSALHIRAVDQVEGDDE